MNNSFSITFDHVTISIIDVFWSLLFIVFIVLLSGSKKTKMMDIEGNGHYKYYMYNVYFKLSFALIYTAIYLFIYGGGDTTAYYNGAANLNNLFRSSPIDYWNEMLMTPGRGLQILHFTSETAPVGVFDVLFGSWRGVFILNE